LNYKLTLSAKPDAANHAATATEKLAASGEEENRSEAHGTSPQVKQSSEFLYLRIPSTNKVLVAKKRKGELNVAS